MHINVVNKRCEHPGCRMRAHYGPLYSAATHCAKHRIVGEYANRYPTCKIPGCDERTSWSDTLENYPTLCSAHAEQLTFDIKNQPPQSDSSPTCECIIPHEIANLECKICANVRPCNCTTGMCDACAGLSAPRAIHHICKERMSLVLNKCPIKPDAHDTRLQYGVACDIKSRPDFIFYRPHY